MRKSFILFLTFLFLEISFQQKSKALEEGIQKALHDVQCLDKMDNTTCVVPYCEYSNNASAYTENRDWYTVVSEIQLLCKDETYIGIQWEAKVPLIALIEARTNESEWELMIQTTCSRARVKNLMADTVYEIRLWGVSQEGILYGPTNVTSIKTFPTGHELSPPLVSNVIWEAVGNNCTAIVKWEPSDDYACFYHIAVLPLNELQKPIQYNINEVKDLFNVHITNLMLDSTYIIMIHSKSGDLQRESNGTELKVDAPTCLKQYNNDLTKCVPPPPNNVQVTGYECYRVNPENFSCDVTVSWTEPEVTPDFYTASVYTEFFARLNESASPNETSIEFYNLPLESKYFIAVQAWSKAGGSEIANGEWTRNVTSVLSDIDITPVTAPWFKIASVGLGIVFSIAAIGVLLYLRYRLRMLKQDNDSTAQKYYDENLKDKFAPSLNNTTSEYYIPEIVNDEWQLNTDQVVLDKLLGEGAFGIVHKGFMKSNDGKEVEVAVKMLRGSPSMEEVRQFQQEIEIMKSVGNHPHLVSLRGCCLKKGYLGPCLVVEYCAKGDLQSYLRAVWEKISEQSLGGHYNNLHSFQDDNLPIENNFSNKVYELCDDALLEPKDLLSFSRQIILGMEYLSNLRVVHRDLAARNVLMCENRVIKVADFGLSRDVYQNNIYTKTGSGKLPVKWMALESLSHQQYTTQSDVWSFGIVLWEIVTLGGNPYATVPTGQLLNLLRSGYRMECPQNCSPELYDIMQLCWKESPKERPTFSDLKRIVEKLIENKIPYISLRF